MHALPEWDAAMKCGGRFSTCDGADLRRVLVWPSLLHVVMCRGCRRAAESLGVDIRAT